jgi:hypothetical protein
LKPKRKEGLLDPRSAITLLTQSEKIKAGILWISHASGVFSSLPENRRPGAQTVFHAFVSMLLLEVRMVRNATDDPEWEEVERHVDMALVMVDSGVPGEASFHLTRALSRTTGKAKEAMESLESWGLL